MGQCLEVSPVAVSPVAVSPVGVSPVAMSPVAVSPAPNGTRLGRRGACQKLALVNGPSLSFVPSQGHGDLGKV